MEPRLTQEKTELSAKANRGEEFMPGFTDAEMIQFVEPGAWSSPVLGGAVHLAVKRGLVEAAGVEPASEMARHDKTTCVSDSESQLRALNRQETTKPSLIDLGLLPQTEALGLSCKMTLTR